MKKSRKGLLLLLLLPELILLLLRLPEAGEAVADAEEAVAEAGHWPSLLLRSESDKKKVCSLPTSKNVTTSECYTYTANLGFVRIKFKNPYLRYITIPWK